MLRSYFLSLIWLQVPEVGFSRGASISPVDNGVYDGDVRFGTDADRRVDEFQFSFRSRTSK